MFASISLLELIIILVLIFIILNLNNWQNYKMLKLYSEWLFSRLFVYFPRDSKLVVFSSEQGKKMGGNPYFLFLKVRALYPKYRLVWVMKSAEEVSRLNALGIESYRGKSLKGMWLQMRAKLIIHSHSIVDDFIKSFVSGAISINTWHGVGLKKVWGANSKTFTYRIMHGKSKFKRALKLPLVYMNRTKRSYMISTSERVSKYYPETFLVEPSEVFALGQARNDVFFESVQEEESLPELFKSEKIILYMPTHRQNGNVGISLSKWLDLSKIDALCEEFGYKFIIKLHPFNPPQEVKLYKNILDYTKTPLDTQILLKYTDILVTDYSSCYTDFLLLDRPVLFFAYDLYQYLAQDRNMYFDFFEVTPGIISKSKSEFIDSLHLTLEGVDEFEAERKRVLDIFYSQENQGLTAEKQVKFIFEKFMKE